MALASAAVLCVYVCSYLSGAGICSLLLMTAEYMEYGDLSVYVLLCYASTLAVFYGRKPGPGIINELSCDG
jgi:hypothetical protein